MIIIDVGAHNGQTIALPYAQDPSHLVYAIEPIPELADQLKAQALPNLHVFQIAMGDRNTSVPFHINHASETSSVLKATCDGQWQPYTEQLREIRTIDVPMMRLDTWMDAQGIVEVDLLKIDAQGYDFAVLRGLGDSIRCIKKIILEVQIQPLYEGAATKAAIVEHLTTQGFALLIATPQTDGLEENLEFVRVNRYSLNLNLPDAPVDTAASGIGLHNATPSPFYVTIPYTGTLALPAADHVGQLLEEGIFEGPEQAFLWLYLRPGDVFFDCGAHAGMFSCIAARCLGTEGRIVGFEPNPLCFDLYQQNLAEIAHPEVTALPVGLADQDQTGNLWLGKPGMSAFSTFAAGATTHEQIGETTLPVDLRCLDSVLADLDADRPLGTVTLAKLDVEGWEALVLKGASQSIRDRRFPLWMIEFTETNAIAAGSSTQALRATIEALGYTLCRFDATRFRLVPEPLKLVYPYENLYAVMDLDWANQRLTTTTPERRAIAQDIIARSDSAILGFGHRQQATQERKTVEKLRQQIHHLTAQLQQAQTAHPQLTSQPTSQPTVLDASRDRADRAEARIRAMESSKFWKLRTWWFRVKKQLRLPNNE